jgi:hypothetical protein
VQAQLAEVVVSQESAQSQLRFLTDMLSEKAPIAGRPRDWQQGSQRAAGLLHDQDSVFNVQPLMAAAPTMRTSMRRATRCFRVRSMESFLARGTGNRGKVACSDS